MAEIQQVSDVTYRLYDWGREKNPAISRETHLDLAIDCINYSKFEFNKTSVEESKEESSRTILVDCNYFKLA